MSLEPIVNETVNGLMNTIQDYEFSGDQKQALEKLIVNSITKAINQTSKIHNETTVMCCGPEADIAHNIAWETKQKTKLLISSLSLLR